MIILATFGIGFVASMLGLGGGFLVVPLLIFAGLSAHSAIGTTISIAMFVGFSSFAEYYRQGRVDWELAIVLECASIPGSTLGAYLTSYVSSDQLIFLFILILIMISFFLISQPSIITNFKFNHLIWKREIIDRNDQRFNYQVNLFLALLLGFFAGLAAGFLGISGGIIKVPILIFVGVPIHVAVATSSLMISLTSSAAFATHFFLGNVDYRYLILVSPGIILGAQLGARKAGKIKPKKLKKIFSILLLLAAIAMLARLLS
jgi:uncharacterized membrane protein YfcA